MRGPERRDTLGRDGARSVPERGGAGTAPGGAMQETAQETTPALALRGTVEAPGVPTGVAADAAAAVASDRAAEAGKLGPALLVNRELSLLAFQWRVFEEASDP